MEAKTIAIVDTDTFYRDRLAAAMEKLGVPATGYADLALVDTEAFGHGGYVLASAASKGLVRLLRRRGKSAILLLSDSARPDHAQAALDGGPAQQLTKFKAVQDVATSVAAAMGRAWQRGGVMAWQLDRRARQLTAPDGARVDLSVDEVEWLACFVPAAGNVVKREAMPGRPAPGSADPVYAAMLRLQRRAERLTPMTLPFRVWARSGYSFDGHLEEA